METCEYCGYTEEDCDGILTLGEDPFQSEINEDYTEYWMCQGQRWDSAMEI